MSKLSNFFLKIILILFCLHSGVILAQDQEEISGIVLDAVNSKPMPGASVYWENDISSGVVTNLEGQFLIRSTALPARLVISFLGYQKSIRSINLNESLKLVKIFLKPEDLSLEEVIIQERRPDQQIKSLETGKVSVAMETLRNIPALFGEVDLLRSLQLLPGVQSAGEGTTGLFVRGGSNDQNLVQIDGAPVYNASHFFGFFSVFNPDALDKVDLYKGNMPSSFGGRLSSLIDVSLKEGNNQQIHGEGGIGSISSRFTINGPLGGEKSTFVVSGRRTYADVFLKLSGDEDLRNNSLNFHDLSAKFVFRIGDKDKLTVSSYQGADFLGLDDSFGLGWSNWVSSAQWNRNLSDRAYFDLQVYHSKYDYLIEFDDVDNGFEWNNKLSETGAKAQWSITSKTNSQVFWGFQTQYYHFSPIELLPLGENTITPIVTNPKNGLLNSFFFGFTHAFNPKLSAEGGLRAGFYNQIGNGVDYLYSTPSPQNSDDIIDSIRYNTLENIKFYQGLEPRLAFRYLINEQFSIKTAYNRNFQYVQIASNSSAGLPIDRWILAGTYVPPIRADQISLGLFHNFDENRWEFSVEGYYKDFRNIIDLKNGANVLFNDNVETEILTGNGWAYGAEFLLRKNIGKTSGWLAYTYARTWRKIEGISEGKAYNPRYDRPNDVTLVVNHEFSPRWSAGMTFVYTTGQAVSFPIGTYTVDRQVLPLYSELRNEDRFPDYHRMDASVIYKNTDKGKKWSGSWNFSIYNLYGRKNPFSYEFREIYNNDIRFEKSEDGPSVSSRPGVVMTYLFTFLPSITYNFKF